jgi:hypothetical protein
MPQISPKARNPALVLFAAGIVLVIVGALIPDETLRTLGYGALGSALAGFGVAYASSPTPTTPKE